MRVTVRVRPPLPREIDATGCFRACVACPRPVAAPAGAASAPGHDVYVTTTDEAVLVGGGGGPSGKQKSKRRVKGKSTGPTQSLRAFHFDAVFEGVSSTEDVYASACSDVATLALRGRNATVFAYVCVRSRARAWPLSTAAPLRARPALTRPPPRPRVRGNGSVLRMNVPPCPGVCATPAQSCAGGRWLAILCLALLLFLWVPGHPRTTTPPPPHTHTRAHARTHTISVSLTLPGIAGRRRYGQTGTGKTYTMHGGSTPTAFPPSSSASGDPSSSARHGVAGLIARDLFAATAQGARAATIEVACLQIYGSHLTDLLGDGDVGRCLRVRAVAPHRTGSDRAGAGPHTHTHTHTHQHSRTRSVEVEGLTWHRLSCVDGLGALERRAASRRNVAATKLNATSSRSHMVMTFRVTTTRGGGATGCAASTREKAVAKINVVDLAGSERVKDSGVAGQDLRDAAAINLSLFHLVGVVKALAAHQDGGGKCGEADGVPYNRSKLTTVLRDSLGGGCFTSLIATISPAQEHAHETVSTLKFAQACTKVAHTEQAAAAASAAESARQAEASLAEGRRRRGEARRVAGARLPWAEWRLAPLPSSHGAASLAPLAAPRPDANTLTTVTTVATDAGVTTVPYTRRTVALGLSGFGASGQVSCLCAGSPHAPRGLALCLHGHPSSAEAFEWVLPALVHAGYYAVAVDMPGRGASTGTPLLTRSEHNLDQGGACDVAVAAIAALAAPTEGGDGGDDNCGAAGSGEGARPGVGAEACAGVDGGNQREARPGPRAGEGEAGESEAGEAGEGAGRSKRQTRARKHKPRAVLVGYDWGGGVALSCGASKRHRGFVSHIVAFHPSYQEASAGELKRIGCPVHLVWCKQDQFHSWNKWKANSSALAASLGQSRYKLLLLDEPQYAKYNWRRHLDKIQLSIVEFVIGKSLNLNPDRAYKQVYGRASQTPPA